MYNNGITSLLQTSKTAKSGLKTSARNEFYHDVEYLQIYAQAKRNCGLLLPQNTRLKLALCRLVKGRSVLIKLRVRTVYDCTTDGNLKD